MGAPVGNLNAAKGQKYIYEALRKALVQDDKKRLAIGMEKVLDLVSEGDPWAMSFVRDTLDGKPAQSVTVSGDADNPLLTQLNVSFK